MLNKGLILLLSFLAAFGASFGFFWYQATRLPDWYQQSQIEPTVGTVVVPAEVRQPERRQQIQTQLAQKVAVEPASEKAIPALSKVSTLQLTAKELNELVVTSLPVTPENEQLLQAVEGIKTEIQPDGKVKTEMVVRATDIPLDQLPLSVRTPIETALHTFPLLQNQPVSIKLEGQPRVTQGQLQLDKDTQITIGAIQLPLAEVVQKLGLPDQPEGHPVVLQVGPLAVQDIEFGNQMAVLRGQLDPSPISGN